MAFFQRIFDPDEAAQNVIEVGSKKFWDLHNRRNSLCPSRAYPLFKAVITHSIRDYAYVNAEDSVHEDESAQRHNPSNGVPINLVHADSRGNYTSSANNRSDLTPVARPKHSWADSKARSSSGSRANEEACIVPIELELPRSKEIFRAIKNEPTQVVIHPSGSLSLMRHQSI